jgi:PAS domain S-box-containing protein
MNYNNFSKDELIEEIVKLKNQNNDINKDISKDDGRFIKQLLIEEAFYNSPEAIIIVKANSREVFAINKKFIDLFGYQEDELIGKDVKTIGIWVNLEKRDEYFRNLINDGAISFEEDFKYKNGTIKRLTVFTKLIKIFNQIYFVSYFDSTGILLKKLQKSENKYKILSENIKDVIWELDPYEMKFTFVSPSVYYLRGYTPEEIMEKPFKYHVDENSFNFASEIIKKRIIEYENNKIIPEGFFKYEVKQPCKNGSFVWTEIVISYFVDEETGKLMLRGVSRDINERKENEQKLLTAYEEYKTLFENASETIILLQDNYIKKANKAALALTNYTYEELYNTPFINFVADEFKETVIINHKKRLNDELFNEKYNIKIKCKNNITKWVIVSGVKIMWQGKVATLNFISDVTEQKETQEKLIKQYEDLMVTNKQKDKLFSIISHDLKNPLHVILALSEILTSDSDNIPNEEKYQLAKEIRKSAKTLRKILDDLLSWTKLKQNMVAFSPKEINLAEIINDAFLHNFDLAREKNVFIDIDIDDNLSIFGDENLLKSLFRNLLVNSIKFSYNNSKVEISSELLQNKDILVKVKDYGIGMPKDIAEHLFELGYKIQRVGTNNEPSTGLGLQIVKHIADVHKAELWFETEENKGTTFFIKFLYDVKLN